MTVAVWRGEMTREEEREKITDCIHCLYTQGSFSEFLWTNIFKFFLFWGFSLVAHTDTAAVKLGDWGFPSAGHGK